MCGNFGQGTGRSQDESGDPVPKSLNGIRKSHIARVLRLAGGDLKKAAEMLEISPAELRHWMDKYSIG